VIFRSRFPDVDIPEVGLEQFVLENAQRFGDRPALINGPSGRTVTYAALVQLIHGLARGLAERGFRKGDVFAVYSPNLPEYAAVLHAVAMLGGITTTVNPLYTVHELAEQFHDLGKLMLAFVMVWAYISFSQFLIIWSGNLPEEIPWYLRRFTGGWRFVGLFLVVFHFALPFLLLLSRGLKRRPRALGLLAAAMLAVRVVDLFWIVRPEFFHRGLDLHWLDLTLPIAIGGVWLGVFAWQLKSRPLVPLGEPEVQEMLAEAHA